MLDFVSEKLESAKFRFAKTMPTIPHEYSLKKSWESERDFEFIVSYIRENGVAEMFGRKQFIYLYIGDYKYWTMGSPIERTILINRAKVKSYEPV